VTYEEALRLLPPAYVQALHLLSQGWDEQRIASELAVDEAAVGPLLRLAEAKLTRLLNTEQDTKRSETEPVAAEDGP
jgi:DNA-directed RNA polymerase specialized sigma24 family protein